VRDACWGHALLRYSSGPSAQPLHGDTIGAKLDRRCAVSMTGRRWSTASEYAVVLTGYSVDAADRVRPVVDLRMQRQSGLAQRSASPAGGCPFRRAATCVHPGGGGFNMSQHGVAGHNSQFWQLNTVLAHVQMCLAALTDETIVAIEAQLRRRHPAPDRLHSLTRMSTRWWACAPANSCQFDAASRVVKSKGARHMKGCSWPLSETGTPQPSGARAVPVRIQGIVLRWPPGVRLY
jgi:hypothetical protein